MKKAIFIAISLAFLSINAFAFKFEMKGTFLIPADKAFKEIYGNNPFYGFEIEIGLPANLRFWLNGNYLTSKGKLTYSQEDTKLNIIPATGGLRIYLTKGIFSAYLGIGGRYYYFKESSPIGTFQKSGFGIVGETGLFIRITRGILFDVRIGYSSCKMQTTDFLINLGGLELGCGLALGK